MPVNDKGFLVANEQYQETEFKAKRKLSNADVCAHHAPGLDGINRIANIRFAAAHFMDVIDANCPPSADRTLAKVKAREAMMMANASIVLNGMS